MRGAKTLEPGTRVLVTGASGKIGSRLAHKLAKQGLSVYALSTINSFKNVPEIKYIHRERGKPIADNLPEVDFVFHLAAQTSAYVARASVLEDLRTNLIETVELIERLAHQSQPPCLIYAGSMTEYGMGKEGVISEDYPVDPQTFYDVGKVANELYLGQYVREGKLKSCVTLRLANIYGAQQHSKLSERGFLDRCIKDAINGRNVELYGDGDYLRDYLHVDDAVEAFFQASKVARKGQATFFNIGTGNAVRLRTALNLIVEGANDLTGNTCKIVMKDFPHEAYSIERRNSVTNPKLFMDQTGWFPSIEFTEGISRELKRAFSSLEQ